MRVVNARRQNYET